MEKYSEKDITRAALYIWNAAIFSASEKGDKLKCYQK